MKKLSLIIVSFLFVAFAGFSQGIEFEHGSWSEVLTKAKQTHKPVFVDVFTTWCGPCKMMSSTIFPMPEVGKEFNASFVCYKLDAEKGEGIKLARQYEVTAYPTYLFVKEDGTLIMKAVGSMPAEKFLALSKSVKDELANPKPFSEWEKEYAQKNTDPAFILKYMQKRSQIGKPNTELFDEYLALLPVEQRASPEIIEIYQKESRNLKVNSLAYKNLQDNYSPFFSKLGGYIYVILMGAVDNSFRDAVTTKNEQLLQQVVEANSKLPKTPNSKTADELNMNYYKKTGDIEKYICYATAFCEGSLMNITIDSIAKTDKKKLDDLESAISSGYMQKIDSAQLIQLRSYMAHALRDKFSQSLNDVAWGFFEKVTDVKALEKALFWSKRSLEIYPGNGMYIDTYANLLYKTGNTKASIEEEQKAMEAAKSTDDKNLVESIEKTLVKMKKGEKTWK